MPSESELRGLQKEKAGFYCKVPLGYACEHFVSIDLHHCGNQTGGQVMKSLKVKIAILISALVATAAAMAALAPYSWSP